MEKIIELFENQINHILKSITTSEEKLKYYDLLDKLEKNIDEELDTNILEEVKNYYSLDIDIDFYKQAHTLSKMDAPLLASQIEKSKLLISKLKEMLRVQKDKIGITLGKIKFTLKEEKERITYLKILSEKLKNQSILTTKDLTEIEEIIKTKLTERELLELILELVQKNALKLEENIRVKNEAREIEIAEKKKKLEKKPARPRVKILKKVDDEYASIITLAKEIIEANKDNLIESEEIDLSLELLNGNNNLEDRNYVIYSFTDIALRKSLLIEDLANLINSPLNEKTKLLIERDIKIIKEIDRILSQRENLVVNEVLIKRSNELLQKIETELKLRGYTLSPEEYERTLKVHNTLSEKLNDYKESVNVIQNHFISEDNFIEKYERELEDAYNEATKLHFTEPEPEVKDVKGSILSKLNPKLYIDGAPVHNILIFLDEDGISLAEKDMLEDGTLGSSDYYQFVSLLKELKGKPAAELTIEDTHRILTDKFSEEFLKKYKVKPLRKSRFRLFINRFSTTLNVVFPELPEDISIEFIISGGFGNINGAKKSELMEDALRRVNKYRDLIDGYIEFFNKDVSTMTDEEKENYKKQIIAIIENENKKAEHIFETEEELRRGLKWQKNK